MDLLDNPVVRQDCQRIFQTVQRRPSDATAAEIAKQLRKAARSFKQRQVVQLTEALLTEAGLSDPLPDPTGLSEEEIAKYCRQLKELASYQEELAKQSGRWKGGRKQVPGVREIVNLLHEVYIEHSDEPVSAYREHGSQIVQGGFAEFVRRCFQSFWDDSGTSPPWTAIDDAIMELMETGAELSNNW